MGTCASGNVSIASIRAKIEATESYISRGAFIKRLCGRFCRTFFNKWFGFALQDRDDGGNSRRRGIELDTSLPVRNSLYKEEER